MENGKTGRNRSIDFIKGTAALLVCFQHSCRDGLLTGYLLAAARTAVPLFVMTTAYFYPDTVRKGKEKSQILRFFIIGAEIVVFYFLAETAFRIPSGEAGAYLRSVFSPEAVRNFLLFNDPVPGDHSWYMWAMIYTLLLVRLLPGIYRQRSVRTGITAASLLLQTGISKYFFLFTGSDPWTLLYRNFLVPVLGYFLLGLSVREWKEEGRSGKAASSHWGLFLLVSLFLLAAEKTLLWKLGAERESGTFLMAVFAALFFFLYALQKEPKTKAGRYISLFGRKYSLFFYMIHPLFVKLEVRLFRMDSWQQIPGMLFVYAASLASAAAVIKILEKVNFKGRKYVC